MNKIEVKVLNPEAAAFGEKMMVFGSRLTQRGHQIKNMDDLMELFNRSYRDSTCEMMIGLPHVNPKRHAMITVAVVGASRRFLAQITRHQDDVHFISASLQYSDYAGEADFCVPYELTEKDAAHVGNAEFVEGYFTKNYLNSEKQAMIEYAAARAQGVDNDTCGYMAPQGLRNILLITATPFEWIHMISQRVCRRNTPETQYVMCLIWEQLWPLSSMFHMLCLPDCGQQGGCREGMKFSCMHRFIDKEVDNYRYEHNCSIPTAFLNVNYPLIRQDKINELEATK